MSPSRKLVVILHADVVGSTALVQINEAIAHQRIRDVFRRFADRIEAHGGIAHEIRGDALMAEFSRASDAVAAAIAYQSENTQLLDTPHTVDIMRFWKSLAQFSLLDYAAAIATLKSITGLDYVKNLLLAACYAQLGQTDEAQAMMQAVLHVRPNLHLSDLGIYDNFRLEKNR